MIYLDLLEVWWKASHPVSWWNSAAKARLER